MKQVKEWVYDPTSNKKLEFSIKSMGVRKCLDKSIKKEYMNSGMFFNWNRKTHDCYVEKTRRFNQKNFLRGFAKKNVKRDQDLVATLGFFDIDTDKKKKGPIDPVFS